MGAILKREKKSLPGAGGGRRVKVLERQLRGGSLLRPPPTRRPRAPGRPWQVGSARGGRARGLRRGRKRGPGGSARPDAPGVSTGAGGGGGCPAGGSDLQWCFSQVKGAVDEDVAEGKAARFCVPSPHPALGDPGLVAAPGSWPPRGAARWRRVVAPSARQVPGPRPGRPGGLWEEPEVPACPGLGPEGCCVPGPFRCGRPPPALGRLEIAAETGLEERNRGTAAGERRCPPRALVACGAWAGWWASAPRLRTEGWGFVISSFKFLPQVLLLNLVMLLEVGCSFLHRVPSEPGYSGFGVLGGTLPVLKHSDALLSRVRGRG